MNKWKKELLGSGVERGRIPRSESWAFKHAVTTEEASGALKVGRLCLPLWSRPATGPLLVTGGLWVFDTTCGAEHTSPRRF